MTKALVVGSGVGGLTAAVALRQAGLEVEVFERAPDSRSIRVGGGLHLWPNGMRALQYAGLAEQVEAVGETLVRLDWFTPEDGLLASADLAATARAVGAPSVGIRRSDLLATLLAEVGEETIQFGREVVGFEQDTQRVVVWLADGSQRSGDVLIGADGLRSTVRTAVAGETELCLPGVLVCQATSEVRESIPAAVFAEVWATELRFGCYPVRDGVFWFAFLRSSETEALRTGPREHLLGRTKGWTTPARHVIEATPPSAVAWGDVVAQAPLERWSVGRVTLLGDAAHAMTPFTGQGACQALEDAVVLASCLGSASDVPTALRRYEARRMSRTSEIWSRSWAGATSVARKSRTIDPRRRRAFAAAFERVVWKQLEQTIAQPFLC